MTEPGEGRTAWDRWEIPLLVLALLPPAYLLRTILRLGVDTPYMDQWEVAPLFAKWNDGTLSFGDLWALQNESRMVFPRLLFLGLGLLTGWNMVAEMIPAFLLACFALGAIYALDRRTFGGPRFGALARLLVPSLLLFGPIQYENWLWGHQVAVFLPPACLLGGLLVAQSRLGLAAKSVLAALLALVATFSFANGMILWLLLPAAVLATDPADAATRKGRAAFWAAAAVAVVGVYLVGYEKPAAQPGFLEALRAPGTSAHYLLVLLGSPLGEGYGHTGIEASTVAGTVLLAAFVAAAVFAVRRRADGAFLTAALPWLLLGGYALGTGIVTTAGRAGFGVPHALSPRYTTFALLLAVADFQLLRLAIRELSRDAGDDDRRTILKSVGAFVVAFLAHAHFATSQVALVRMENWRVRRLEARACLAFVEVAPNGHFLVVNAYPDLEKLRERAAAADRLGLLRPAIVRPDTLPSVLGTTPDPAFGAFNAFTEAGDVVGCRGRAVLPGRGEEPDAILVGWLAEDGMRGVVAVAQAGKRRLSNREPPTADFERTTEWECRVPRDAIPPSVRVLRAWAYDTETGRATLLPGTAALSAK